MRKNSGPSDVIALLATRSKPYSGKRGLLLDVNGQSEVEDLLEALLNDLIDFLHIQTPPTTMNLLCFMRGRVRISIVFPARL